MKKRVLFLMISAVAMASALAGCSKNSKDEKVMSAEDAVTEIVGTYQGKLELDGEPVYAMSDKLIQDLLKKASEELLKDIREQDQSFKVLKKEAKAVVVDLAEFKFESSDVQNSADMIYLNVKGEQRTEIKDIKGTIVLSPIADIAGPSGVKYSISYSKKAKTFMFRLKMKIEMEMELAENQKMSGTVTLNLKLTGTKI